MEFNFNLPGLSRAKSSRPQRVAEAIKNELTLLLLKKIRDPRLAKVFISSVKMAPDLQRATIYFCLPPGEDAKKALQGFDKAKGFCRSQLAALLNLRYTPELVFHYDERHEELTRLAELFREIAEDTTTDDDQS